MKQKVEKRTTLVKALFWLDQPGPDFCFYRVMRAMGAKENWTVLCG
jgi:hypothetical protein